MKRAFPCFSCGRPMKMVDVLAGWCEHCQVMEEHETEPYLCRTQHVTSAIFWDQEIRYLDHGAGNYPSPA